MTADVTHFSTYVLLNGHAQEEVWDKDFVPIYTYSDEEIRNSYVASTDNIELYQKISEKVEYKK